MAAAHAAQQAAAPEGFPALGHSLKADVWGTIPARIKRLHYEGNEGHTALYQGCILPQQQSEWDQIHNLLCMPLLPPQQQSYHALADQPEAVLQHLAIPKALNRSQGQGVPTCPL